MLLNSLTYALDVIHLKQGVARRLNHYETYVFLYQHLADLVHSGARLDGMLTQPCPEYLTHQVAGTRVEIVLDHDDCPRLQYRKDSRYRRDA